VRLTLAGGLFCACNLDQSSSDEEQPDGAVAPPASETLPSPGSNSSKSAPGSTSDASVVVDSGTTEGGASGTTDAGKKTDAASDAAKDTSSPLIPFGAPCLLSLQCATGLCLPFKDRGLRCTKICASDNDCPNNNDCGDTPRVCEIE
jgi:hypothetical protein